MISSINCIIFFSADESRFVDPMEPAHDLTPGEVRRNRKTKDIDVWEGASGASRDAPRFGLKSNLVSNARKKLVKT